MNVLVINASPKKESNTLQLTRAFLEGTGWSAEIIDAYTQTVNPCIGCFACWNKTPGTCIYADDMTALRKKMIAADVIIWSFPLYYYSVPGVLKHIFDRQLPNLLPFMASDAETGGHPSRYDTSHQKHVVISTCGFWTAQGNYAGVDAIFEHAFDRVTKIYCGQGELFSVPELRDCTGAYLQIVKQAGAEFATTSISDMTRAQLETPLFPCAKFEAMADASWGIDAEKGEALDESLILTQQMATLYNPDDKTRVLEFHYTDIKKHYQMLLSPNGATVITENFKPYTTKIETPFSVWQSIARGEVTGQAALFARKYTVQGDFDLMLHWDDLFGFSATSPPKNDTTPNMLLLLAPWIAFWSLLPVHTTIGGYFSILTAALIPLFWKKFKPVIYEQVTIPMVTLISLCALLGISTQILITISYALFGTLWLISMATKTPLSAHYSARGYGADRAFQNPLFMKTNHILTGVWGLMYLCTAASSYVLMGTPIAPYLGLVNNIAPIVTGLFTVWFQKWYPAKFARS